MLIQFLTGAVDRVLLSVQQVLHEENQLDFATCVDAVAAPILGGIEELELALPIPEDVRLEFGE